MRLSDSRKAWLDKMTTEYQQALTPSVVSYLNERGLDSHAVDTYRLGLVDVPDPLHTPYQGRLAIPYLTPTGVVSLRFRCLVDHDHAAENCPKYIQVEGEQTRLYNVTALHSADTEVGIAEGELDAAIATQAGLPTVGISGANKWQPHWDRLFQDFDRVLLLGDGDKAGRQMVAKVMGILPNAEARTMPEGHDVNSFILAYDEYEFLAHALA